MANTTTWKWQLILNIDGEDKRLTGKTVGAPADATAQSILPGILADLPKLGRNVELRAYSATRV